MLKVNQQTSRPKTVTRDGEIMQPLSSRAAFDDATAGWFFDAPAHVVWVKFRQSASSGTAVKF